MEANSIIRDQAAPKGAVWSGSILFAFCATKVHKGDKRADNICHEWWEKVYNLLK